MKTCIFENSEESFAIFIRISESLFGDSAKVDALGKIGKGVKCTVSGCGKDAVRSISTTKARSAGLKVEGKRSYLCEEHYKEYKKGIKKERKIEKMRFGV